MENPVNRCRVSQLVCGTIFIADRLLLWLFIYGTERNAGRSYHRRRDLSLICNPLKLKKGKIWSVQSVVGAFTTAGRALMSWHFY